MQRTVPKTGMGATVVATCLYARSYCVGCMLQFACRARHVRARSLKLRLLFALIMLLACLPASRVRAKRGGLKSARAPFWLKG